MVTAVASETEERLDRALSMRGLARSRNQAVELIAAGLVTIDGAVATKASQRVSATQSISVAATEHYVSRGAHKLLAALDAFGVTVEGKIVADIGASTGGFTQVLLERGATRVLAVDVGHDQLAQQLRSDARVSLVEGCNARYLTAESLAEATNVEEAPSLIVSDLSFISLTLVLPALAEIGSLSVDFVLLIKPQFEVGRESIRDGVVTEPALMVHAIESVLGAAAEVGLGVGGIIESPVLGGKGNREFLVHLMRENCPDPTQWKKTVHELVLGSVGRHA